MSYNVNIPFEILETVSRGHVRAERVPMPTYVLICKTCNIYKDFQVHPNELRNAPDGPIISKWCPMCLKTTEWIAAFQERRCGRDRRRGVERRIPI